MKISLTIGLLIGTITQETLGIQLGRHHRHHKHQSLAQDVDRFSSSNEAWINDCSPSRKMDGAYGSGTQGAPGATKGSFSGVGVDCQGFAQKRKQSLAQDFDIDSNQDNQAWIDDCDPTRNLSDPTYGSGTFNSPAGSAKGGSYEGVGVDCQGFAQRRRQNLAQDVDRFSSSNDAWVEPCDPDRSMGGSYGSGTHGSPGSDGGSYGGVGIDCQGFSQRKSQRLAQNRDIDRFSSSNDAWVDPCGPERVLNDATYGSGTQGSPGADNKGSYTGVGIDCQGFAQKKGLRLAQIQDDATPDPYFDKHSSSNEAWIDDCSPDRVMNGEYGSGTQGAPGATNGSFAGVGVDCQGFAQRKSISLAQTQDFDIDRHSSNNNAWVDDCSPGRKLDDPVYGSGTQGSPSALPNGSYTGVGVECQGFAQTKSISLAQTQDPYFDRHSSANDAWIDDCSPTRKLNDPVYGSGTQGAPGANGKGSFDGVGVECQGFAQQKSVSLAQSDPPKDPYFDRHSSSNTAWVDDCSPDRVMSGDYGSGTQGAPGNNGKGSYDGVGIDCQGFAQKNHQSLAQDIPEKDNQAWVDDCAPDRNLSNPTFGTGTHGSPGAESNGSYKGVGVDCQGFAQKKQQSLVQDDGYFDKHSSSNTAWVDDCDPGRKLNDPVYGSGTFGSPGASAGTYPHVGVDCQGFAQISTKNKQKHRNFSIKRRLQRNKGCPDEDLPDCNGTNGEEGKDCC